MKNMQKYSLAKQSSIVKGSHLVAHIAECRVQIEVSTKINRIKVTETFENFYQHKQSVEGFLSEENKMKST